MGNSFSWAYGKAARPLKKHQHCEQGGLALFPGHMSNDACYVMHKQAAANQLCSLSCREGCGVVGSSFESCI